MIVSFMKQSGTKKGHVIGIAASVAVSLGIIIYLFAQIDWHEVWAQLKKIHPWSPPLLMMLFLPILWMRAMRWRLILPNGKALSIPRLVDATVIGFFASFVLPLRAGEIIRPWVLSRWQPVHFSSALASIMIERLADSVCLLGLMLLCLSKLEEVPPLVLAGAQALGLLTVILIAIVAASYAWPGRMESIFHWFSDRIIGRITRGTAERINRMITDFFRGLRVITSFWQLGTVMVWSLAMWLLVALWYQSLMWAFGEFPSLWVGMMLNVMIALAVAAPSAPGFIGTFQIGCIIALSTVYGYSREFAVAFSVVGHILQMVFNVTAGLIVLHRRGLTFRQLRNKD
jgi:glycosyltransferase 2 family protein